jgi:magnesium-transporting ATPase (P-type)
MATAQVDSERTATAPGRDARRGREQYFSLSAAEVLARLESSPEGITSAEAAARRARSGSNVIAEEAGLPLWRKFVANLTNFFAVLLWVAAGLSFGTDAAAQGVAIIAVIVVNALFSFWQEFRAEQATLALKKLLPAYARVRREGREARILAEGLVPGDVILLEEGDNVSADARLLQAADLRVDTSTLTGESDPVRKSADPHSGEGLTWAQMPNLVFAGTAVAAGAGEAVVFATGMGTELGHIARLTQAVRPERSPLQVQIGRVAGTVTRLSVAMGALFFAVGRVVAHLSLRDGAIFAIGIVLANVPEGLLPTVTLALATGVQRLARRNALVKRLSAVETLGAATVICTDKTGTLTENQMTVREAFAGGREYLVTGLGYEPRGEFRPQPPAEGRPAAVPAEAAGADLRALARAAAFCNNARLVPPDPGRAKWSILGDPTEAALLVAAAKAGFDLDRERLDEPRVHQLPFESRRKRMTVVRRVAPHRAGGAAAAEAGGLLRVYTKGAPRETLALCTRLRRGGRDVPLEEVDRELILAVNDRAARSGLRVLAMATRTLAERPGEYEPESVERDLTFLGLMAMQDPPRAEVEEAVAKARAAGIRVVMITGDYGLTAESVARRIGVVRGPQPRIVTGAELEALGDEALRGLLRAEGEVIFARVAPEHKLRVVEAFRALGEVVAVTGDGVNDAPALKRADIGVAMGRAGTDVAKGAAAMVLTDDNFASIVAAVEEGRAVYDNIRKFVTYIFAHLAGEAVPYLFFALANVPLPLTALQILAIDLGTETLPALALGIERPEPDVMARPPRPRGENLLNLPTLLRGYVFLGLLLAVGVMGGYFWQLRRRGWHWGVTGADPAFAVGSLYQREAATMVFLGIVVMQVANVFACRTERASVFHVGFFSNRLVFAGIAFELLFVAVLIYVPFFQRIFGTAPVGWEGWGLLFAFTPVVFLAEEARKAWVRGRVRQARPSRAGARREA